jgi:hypothetical protein
MSALKEDSAFMHEMFVRLKSPDIPNQAKKDLVTFEDSKLFIIYYFLYIVKTYWYSIVL